MRLARNRKRGGRFKNEYQLKKVERANLLIFLCCRKWLALEF
jgi:hypothetical protein